MLKIGITKYGFLQLVQKGFIKLSTIQFVLFYKCVLEYLNTERVSVKRKLYFTGPPPKGIRIVFKMVCYFNINNNLNIWGNQDMI